MIRRDSNQKMRAWGRPDPAPDLIPLQVLRARPESAAGCERWKGWLTMSRELIYDYNKEKEEAIAAGNKALQSLKRAQEQLNSARNWGIYDIIGGGFISSMIKHGKMDKAQMYIEEARYDLKKFSKELRDVDQLCTADVGSDDFLRFADWFFDGFVSDWMMQSRINKSREQVDQAIRAVEDSLRRLKAL